MTLKENNELLEQCGALTNALVEASRKIAKRDGTEATNEERLANDLKKIVEMKSDNAITDSVTATTAAEVVPAEVKTDIIVENNAVSSRYAFLSAMGLGKVPLMSKNTSYTIEAEGDDFEMITERTSGGNNLSEPGQQYKVAEVNIEAKRQYRSVGLTDELLTFGVYNTLQRVQKRNMDFVLGTVADAVLNADNSTGATGNINSDDQLASTTRGAKNVKLGYDNSIRKVAIANGDTFNVGTATNMNSIFEVAKLLPFDGGPSDRFIVMDNATYYKFMGLDDFKDMSKNGKNSTITEGAITNIAGMDLFITDIMRKTEADGKLSGTTPAGNTLGQFAIVDRDCIQHGFLGNVRTSVEETLEKGVQFESTFYFGFDNLSRKNDDRVKCALGINVDLT